MSKTDPSDLISKVISLDYDLEDKSTIQKYLFLIEQFEVKGDNLKYLLLNSFDKYNYAYYILDVLCENNHKIRIYKRNKISYLHIGRPCQICNGKIVKSHLFDKKFSDDFFISFNKPLDPKESEKIEEIEEIVKKFNSDCKELLSPLIQETQDKLKTLLTNYVCLKHGYQNELLDLYDNSIYHKDYFEILDNSPSMKKQIDYLFIKFIQELTSPEISGDLGEKKIVKRENKEKIF